MIKIKLIIKVKLILKKKFIVFIEANPDKRWKWHRTW